MLVDGSDERALNGMLGAAAQLEAGSKFTVAQAEYAAKRVGLC